MRVILSVWVQPVVSVLEGDIHTHLLKHVRVSDFIVMGPASQLAVHWRGMIWVQHWSGIHTHLLNHVRVSSKLFKCINHVCCTSCRSMKEETSLKNFDLDPVILTYRLDMNL